MSIINKIIGGLEVLRGGPLKPHRNYLKCFDSGHNLWRGSWPSMATIKGLSDNQHVQSIVNLCAERNQDNLVHSFGMMAFNIGVLDETAPSLYKLKQFLQLFHDNSMVHCEAGVGRTGCMVAGYRVLKQGWTPQQALEEAQQFGNLTKEQRQFILNLKK